MITDPEALKGTIIGHRGDRFGGRFAAILTAMRAADVQGVPFRICWSTPPDWEEVCHPEDLFSDAFRAENFVDPALFQKVRWQTERFYPGTYTEEDFKAHVASGSIYLNEDTRARGFPWEDEAEVRAQIPAYWSKLGLAPALEALVAKVDAALDVATANIAYHIRRGDLSGDDEFNSHRNHSGGKYIPLAFYIQHIEQSLERDPDCQFVVFSDEPRVIEILKDKFPSVRGVADITGPMDTTIGQRDFLELYTMSRCPLIVGPPSSAFSAAAAMLGNGNVESIEKDLTPERHTAALDEIVRNIEVGSEAFLGIGDMGQCVPYYLKHMDKLGRGAEATEVMIGHFANGFDRSHIFPLLAGRYFAESRFDQIDELRRIASRGLVMFDALTVLEGYRTLAQLASGDIGEAVRTANAAFWLDPLDALRDPTRLCERMILLMIDAGHLTSENFPPFDPGLSWRRGPLFNEDTDSFNTVNSLTGGGKFARDYAVEAIGRDWMGMGGARIFPAGMSGRFRMRSLVEGRVEKIAMRFADKDDPSLLSMVGLFAKDLEQWDKARINLDAALGADPENPLYMKRRADLHFAQDEPDAGLALISEACDRAEDNIWFEVDLARRTADHGDPIAARKMFVAMAGRKHDFPTIRMMVARHLFRRPNQGERALAEVEAAIDLVPGAPELVLLRGRILAQMGRNDEARADFQYVMISREHERWARSELARLSKG